MRPSMERDAALGLYRIYVDACDEDLRELGVTRDDVLMLARVFDDDTGDDRDPRRALAELIIAAAKALPRPALSDQGGEG